MGDRPPFVGPSAEAGSEGDAAPTAAPADRVLLLECRLEQLLSSLAEARSDADLARTRLAEAAAREADHARRHGLVHEELAAARGEVAGLHRRLQRSEALRAEVEGRLFESGSPDAHELVRLRHEASGTRGEGDAHRQVIAHLRARIDELVASREVLFTRVVEWQRLVRQDDPDALDLAEFIAALRRDILELEHQNYAGERREADLRRRLIDADAGTETPEDDRPVVSPDPEPPADEAPAEARVAEGITAAPEAHDDATMDAAAAREGGRPHELVAALAAARDSQSRIEQLLRLGRSGDDDAFYAIRPWASSTEPGERAAAYQALGRLLERDPSRLEPHLRWGIADPDPRVRRRVILAAATARGLDLRPLLEPLRADPDPQVRRVVNEVLRRPPPGPSRSDGSPVLSGTDRRPPRTSGVAS